MKIFKMLLMGLALTATGAHAAGTCTEGGQIRAILHGSGASVVQTQVDCVADAADGSFPDTAITNVGGNLRAVYFIPGAVTVPTNAMDMTVELGTTGFDLLGGSGADLSTSANSALTPDLGPVYAPAPFAGNLNVTLSNNSVNSATLTYILIFEP